jgi:glucokinase
LRIKQTEKKPCSNNICIDRNAVISRLRIAGFDLLYVEFVRLFVEIYGAETGNLALKSLATNGVFIGGGIGAKILPDAEW